METDADTIETDRLVLRRWRESDAARGRIARYQETFAHRPQGVWAIVPRDSADVPAGAILLKALPDAELGQVEIGWWLHPDSHGRATPRRGRVPCSTTPSPGARPRCGP